MFLSSLLTLTLFAAGSKVQAQEFRVDLTTKGGPAFEASSIFHDGYGFAAGRVRAAEGDALAIVNLTDDWRDKTLFVLPNADYGFRASRADQIFATPWGGIGAVGMSTNADGTGQLLLTALGSGGEVSSSFGQKGIVTWGRFDPATTRVERVIKPFLGGVIFVLVATKSGKKVYALDYDGRLMDMWGGAAGLEVDGAIQDIDYANLGLLVLSKAPEGGHQLEMLDYRTGKRHEVYFDYGRLPLNSALGDLDEIVHLTGGQFEILGRTHDRAVAYRMNGGDDRLELREYAWPEHAGKVEAWWTKQPYGPAGLVTSNASGRVYLASAGDRPLTPEGEIVQNVQMRDSRIFVLTNRAYYRYALE